MHKIRSVTIVLACVSMAVMAMGLPAIESSKETGRGGSKAEARTLIQLIMAYLKNKMSPGQTPEAELNHHPMFPSPADFSRAASLMTDLRDTADKRQFDDYGHMRFGKRADFDDYGHMRFGRSVSNQKLSSSSSKKPH
ncbi:unnamed protein product [Cyprideis torosa]|uniref:Uncharacterized protein n=1 Tax=Cyprideis torosa TaxID=163714 RepID=A0A7R8WH29_9CRUS|nr:unnamed protein product [Cyprideis torosa]CAG0892391.1 unnamed protein product [Cyprideis torosa]